MFEPGLSIEVKKNDTSKTFLFDVMHNPGKSFRPCQQARKLNYNNGEMKFEKIYHTIGNFAPVPRTIISKNYGPNLQQIHLQLNELWPWFLKFLKDNWEEFPTEVAEIMTFEEYMVFTCQQMYFSNIFKSVYDIYNENSNVCWKCIIQQTLKCNISKDDTLISFNELLKSDNVGNIEELDKMIMFLIELRGRCIMHLLQTKVTIDEKILNVYPEIRLGVLQFQADVKAPDERFWAMMDDEVIPQVRAKIDGKEWSQIPGVKGSRAAYKAFGRNPDRYRVSSEALLRRVRRGDALYQINSVVDVNNLISIQSGLSVGAYDNNQISCSVILRKAEQGEGYTGIGKDFLDMENMLVLADDHDIFASSMSNSKRTMVTESTKNVLVVIYCFEEDIDLASLLIEAKTAFEKYASAKHVETQIIDNRQRKKAN